MGNAYSMGWFLLATNSSDNSPNSSQNKDCTGLRLNSGIGGSIYLTWRGKTKAMEIRTQVSYIAAYSGLSLSREINNS